MQTPVPPSLTRDPRCSGALVAIWSSSDGEHCADTSSTGLVPPLLLITLMQRIWRPSGTERHRRHGQNQELRLRNHFRRLLPPILGSSISKPVMTRYSIHTASMSLLTMMTGKQAAKSSSSASMFNDVTLLQHPSYGKGSQATSITKQIPGRHTHHM